MLTYRALCSLSIFCDTAIIRLEAVRYNWQCHILLLRQSRKSTEKQKKDKFFFELKPEIFISHGTFLMQLCAVAKKREGHKSFLRNRDTSCLSLWQIVCTFPIFHPPSRKIVKVQ